MAGCLLDTNHLAAAINPVSKVRERLYQAHRAGIRLGTCIPVLCQLEVGIQQSAHVDTYRRQLQQVLKRVRIWPLETGMAALYGEVYLALKKQGRSLSQVDMMLAAMAKLKNYTLLTTDLGFAALPEIHSGNWLT
jgi:predicted nucleic acid-binding protein